MGGRAGGHLGREERGVSDFTKINKSSTGTLLTSNWFQTGVLTWNHMTAGSREGSDPGELPRPLHLDRDSLPHT